MPNIPAVDFKSPAWWAFILGQLVAVIGLAGAVVHPGYHVPSDTESLVGSLSVLLSVVCTVVYQWHHTRVSVAHVAAAAVAASPPAK